MSQVAVNHLARTKVPGVSAESAPFPGDELGLVKRAQDGDRAAFAALVEKYWDRLYRWLSRLTHDGHAAEDIAQETFLKAYAAIARFRAGSNFQAWLFRIGHNNFVNYRRSHRHARQPLTFEVPQSAQGPVEHTLSQEALQLLGDAVAKLPSDFRGALLLRVEEGLSFREIAGILGITEETARWRVFKARQKLMSMLEES